MLGTLLEVLRLEESYRNIFPHDVIVFIIIITAFPTQSLFHGTINKDFICPQVFPFVIRTCLQLISNDLSSHIHGFCQRFPHAYVLIAGFFF